jgi:hypothetical protein
MAIPNRWFRRSGGWCTPQTNRELSFTYHLAVAAGYSYSLNRCFFSVVRRWCWRGAHLRAALSFSAGTLERTTVRAGSKLSHRLLVHCARRSPMWPGLNALRRPSRGPQFMLVAGHSAVAVLAKSQRDQAWSGTGTNGNRRPEAASEKGSRKYWMIWLEPATLWRSAR